MAPLTGILWIFFFEVCYSPPFFLKTALLWLDMCCGCLSVSKRTSFLRLSTRLSEWRISVLKAGERRSWPRPGGAVRQRGPAAVEITVPLRRRRRAGLRRPGRPRRRRFGQARGRAGPGPRWTGQVSEEFLSPSLPRKSNGSGKSMRNVAAAAAAAPPPPLPTGSL